MEFQTVGKSISDSRNSLLECSHRELTNHLRDHAPGPVQDPNAAAKDDSLVLDPDFEAEGSR